MLVGDKDHGKRGIDFWGILEGKQTETDHQMNIHKEKTEGRRGNQSRIAMISKGPWEGLKNNYFGWWCTTQHRLRKNNVLGQKIKCWFITKKSGVTFGWDVSI